MDIISTLKKDHRAVEDLFAKIFASESSAGRESVFSVLTEEFLKHAQAEEEVVYPALEKIKDLKGKIAHSFEEHEKARSLIEGVESVSAEDQKWQSAVKELQKAIDHHVKEEETVIFPLMKEKMKPSELEVLATKFEGAKSNVALAG